ncbi:MAG: potassium/proton antiporter [Oscillospiraceae bacterium]|nr:potassium/proton antiporter [Oscillospiraceae bacterium]
MEFILFLGIVLCISILSCKATNKAGLPLLVGFMLIGIVIGQWVFHFESEDFNLAVGLCNFALLLIIFTGGFDTNFSEAKPILGVSVFLSILGTTLTAMLGGFFAFFVLKLEFYEAMLMGAVISSTDAASVFSILRSKKLNLKNNLGMVLQIESASNDPTAHMLTVLFLAMAGAGGSQNIFLLFITQLFLGILVGFVGAKVAQFTINRLHSEMEDLYLILLAAFAFLMYGTALLINGNGFIAVYVGGIILSKGKLTHKRHLAQFFGSISMLMQIMLFIILGMLFVPSNFLDIIVIGLAFAVFLLFIARPLVTFVIMKPFGRKLNEIALVSWAGFRGASSIVFAAYLLLADLPYSEYVFSIVFFVCLLSVTFQGSLIVPFAKKLNLIAQEPQVLKSLTEYAAEIQEEILEITISPGSFACGKSILELELPEDVHIIIIRRNGKTMVPIFSTVIQEKDTIMLASGDKEKLLQLRKSLKVKQQINE